MRALVLAALVGAWGCHRVAAPPPADSLSGRTLPLRPSAALELALDGEVAGRPARVELDVTHPLTTASRECFGQEPPRGVGRARRLQPSGQEREWRLVALGSARLGPARLGGLVVGLAEEPGCVLALGMDVLGPYALEVDPVHREVSFSASRPLEAHRAQAAGTGAPVHVLELAREPRGDWPLLAVRLQQAGQAWVAPFVLGTREPVSRLAASAGAQQGLSAQEGRFVLERVELARGVGSGPVALQEDAGWASSAAVGVLGPDVWGRFHATLDVQGGALVLRRLEGAAATPAGVAPAGAATPGGPQEPEDPP